jgi:diguanylate cyclase (GGDEF)-like protein
MRKVCEEMVVLIDTNTISVSVSVGVTEVHPNDNDIEGILRRADVALYLAKTSGRNRVVLNEYDSMPNSAV